MKAALLFLTVLTIQAHAFSKEAADTCAVRKEAIDNYTKDQGELSASEIFALQFVKGDMCRDLHANECLDYMNKVYKENCLTDYKP